MKPDLRKIIVECLWLLFPFLIWIFFYRDYLTGDFTLVGDGPSYYFRTKYFLDSFQTGVFPLWDPYQSWGAVDNFDLRFTGEYNPFLYLIYIFKFLGMPFYHAYIIRLVLYHFVGLAGFYWLAKMVLRDKPAAYAAYLMVMFSAIGPILFYEHVINLILIPMILFFAFLVSFIRRGYRRDLLGLTLSLMIIATTYLPHFFIIIVSTAAILFCLLYYRHVFFILKWTVKRIRKRLATFIFCLLSLALSIVPGLAWFLSAKDPQYVIAFRHTPGAHASVVDIGLINLSGVAFNFGFRDLFSFLDMYDIARTPLFHVSVFVYIIIFITIFNRFSKKLAFFLCFSAVIILISLADVTPVHPFLYKQIPLFRQFRNLFFLISLVTPAIVLFSAEQLRILIKSLTEEKRSKLQSFIVMAVLHAGFGVFLYRMGDILISSYVTLVLSFILFSIIIFKKMFPGQPAGMAFILLTAIIQPAEIHYHYRAGSLTSGWESWESVRQTPYFVYQRPFRTDPEDRLPGYAGYQGRKKQMKDSSGFVESEYYGIKYSYDLHNRMNPEDIQEYVRYKFVVYDNTKLSDAKKTNWDDLRASLKAVKNAAFVYEGKEKKYDLRKERATFIAQESDHLRVTAFGPNQVVVETNFPASKFLVYNDSFHEKWRAFLNGDPVPVYRANYAFKGVDIPAGQHELIFRFGLIWEEIFYRCLVYYFLIFFVILVWFCVPKRKIQQ